MAQRLRLSQSVKSESHGWGLPWWSSGASQDGKELANAGDMKDVGSLGSGRSPGGGHGNPLQYFCLENPMDGGAWRTMVHRVTNQK